MIPYSTTGLLLGLNEVTKEKYLSQTSAPRNSQYTCCFCCQVAAWSPHKPLHAFLSLTKEAVWTSHCMPYLFNYGLPSRSTYNQEIPLAKIFSDKGKKLVICQWLSWPWSGNMIETIDMYGKQLSLQPSPLIFPENILISFLIIYMHTYTYINAYIFIMSMISLS